LLTFDNGCPPCRIFDSIFDEDDGVVTEDMDHIADKAGNAICHLNSIEVYQEVLVRGEGYRPVALVIH